MSSEPPFRGEMLRSKMKSMFTSPFRHTGSASTPRAESPSSLRRIPSGTLSHSSSTTLPSGTAEHKDDHGAGQRTLGLLKDEGGSADEVAKVRTLPKPPDENKVELNLCEPEVKGESAVTNEKVSKDGPLVAPQTNVEPERRAFGLKRNSPSLRQNNVEAEHRPVRPEGMGDGAVTNEKVAKYRLPALSQFVVNTEHRIGLKKRNPSSDQNNVEVEQPVMPEKGEGTVTNERVAKHRLSVPPLNIVITEHRTGGLKRSSSSSSRQNGVEAEHPPIKSEVVGKHQLVTPQNNGETERRIIRLKRTSPDEKIALLQETVQQLRAELAESQRNANGLAQCLHAHEQKHHCESLYTQGRSIEAAQSLLEMVNNITEAVRANKLVMKWISEFTNQCVSTLERIGDEASKIRDGDEAVLTYSILLSLGPPTPNSVLTRWASIILTRRSADDALNTSTKFKFPRLVIYQTVCDVLEGNDRIMEAISCFRQMQIELAGDTNIRDEEVQWELDFQRRCIEKLGKLGSVAMESKNYNEAVEHFSTMLSLASVNRTETLVKRSNAKMLMKQWEGALSDADECINDDPSSYQGHEIRHAALHGAGRHADAVEAFRTMLSKLEASSDKHIRNLRPHYVDAALTILQIIEETIRDMPQVLIDTATGELCDKKQQAEAFLALPIYHELVSSMTKKIDKERIRTEVEQFYRYVMLSHKWEHDEPLLLKVKRITVYKLEPSSENMKLQDFCTLVRSLGFRWAWSDTCCVDKDNKRVLEESLVAMFTWYRGSSLTVVYLRGISSPSQTPGRLRENIWNTRAWTYQEYVAAKTVQFYTEDWKPYLGLTMFNHKDSPVIRSEMQQAAEGSAKDITVLDPGLDRVREKLSLASMRQATLVEDIAYSLLGIFKASIPVQYGERGRAVARLLEYILTGSGDVMVLAWTGRAGSYNSCLPINLTVYHHVLPPHVPQPVESSEMDEMVKALHSSFSDLSLAETLYARLLDLPPPVSLSSRLRLPGVVFRLTGLVHIPSDAEAKSHVYRATTIVFGDVEITTTDDLMKTRSLYIIHPWIRPLLDQEFAHGASELDKRTQAIRLVARLKQRFGALLLEQVSRVEYKRVATDSLIMVQFGQVSLTDLIENIRTIEIL